MGILNYIPFLPIIKHFVKFLQKKTNSSKFLLYSKISSKVSGILSF